ncbi:MAG TPA: RimK/LysX family protein [Polyangiaceae bacterium]|jgi:hypothetical protein|nr:RimK/LysX family protein [Polyangiaceae bacterium]
MSPGAPARRTPARLIGVLERVDIPAWGARGIHARVDTGARTSALHVEALTELGAGRVRFELARGGTDGKRRPPIEATVLRRGRVRSTSGKLESRVFVTARVVLGGAEHRIELGLVDRRHMQNPMLLGRSAIAGRFLVDPGRRYLLGPERRK